jgi:hypothetical protein
MPQFSFNIRGREFVGTNKILEAISEAVGSRTGYAVRILYEGLEIEVPEQLIIDTPENSTLTKQQIASKLQALVFVEADDDRKITDKAAENKSKAIAAIERLIELGINPVQKFKDLEDRVTALEKAK